MQSNVCALGIQWTIAAATLIRQLCEITGRPHSIMRLSMKHLPPTPQTSHHLHPPLISYHSITPRDIATFQAPYHIIPPRDIVTHNIISAWLCVPVGNGPPPTRVV